MLLRVFEKRAALAEAAAGQAARAIRSAIREHGRARVLAASAASQIEFLQALVLVNDIDWTRVDLFHLDEYLNLSGTHPASFCRFLHERLIGPTGITNYHLLDGDRDALEVIRNVSQAISERPVDIAFVGIGENGHLAFNDPPADFETEQPYIVVVLDEACRRQQVAEGWFANLEEVPKQAISMSVRQVLKAKEIVAVVPGARKAEAIKACFDGAISPAAPSSILRNHSNTTVYLDNESAALLSPATLSSFAAA
jgi:glucosamine-6-phosphate deaminase